MYKTILLTIDVNEPASWKDALPRAVELATGWGSRLHVLSVVPDYGLPVVEGFFPVDFREKAIRHGGEALEKLVAAEVPAELKAESHIRYGTVHDEILHAIDAVGADLVVMASHAPDKMREFLIGSQADRVVRRSPVSVLVVRC
ncbi:universal stress protein [Defluviimonas sp. SAOS-178_SWC]|uniref:universal stress protein n=1 Tax=Defluviimonas sp. SAOS-178_SWC TaxID=3121287 RepID=UPI003221F71D